MTISLPRWRKRRNRLSSVIGIQALQRDAPDAFAIKKKKKKKKAPGMPGAFAVDGAVAPKSEAFGSTNGGNAYGR